MRLPKLFFKDTYPRPSSQRIMVLFIVMTLVLMFVVSYLGFKDFTNKNNRTLENTESNLLSIADNITFKLDSSIDHLNMLSQVLTEDVIHEATSFNYLNQVEVLDDSSQFYFHINLKGHHSILSGLGDPKTFSEEKKDHIIDMINLTPYFAQTHANLDSTQWLYFVSKDKMINLYPQATPDEYLFTLDTLTNDFYTLTLPSNNPSRQTMATGVYEDEAGKGLMITLTKPVYHYDKYLGAMAVDFTLNDIKAIFNRYDSSTTRYILVNNFNEVLATNVKDDPLHAQDLSAYLESSNLPISLEDVLDKHISSHGGYTHHTNDIALFSWKIIAITNDGLIMRSIITSQLMFIGLVLVMSFFALLLFRMIKAQQVIYNNQLKFSQVINQTVQLTAILDTSGRMLYVNKTATDMIGTPPEDLVGKFFYEGAWWSWSDDLVSFIKEAVFRANNGESVVKDVVHFDQTGNKAHIEFTLNPIYNNHGQIEYLAANGKDITVRNLLKESIDKLSHMDMLTNIYNRRGITRIIEDEFAKFHRHQTVFSLLLFDIDFFKRVNDTYGHNVGDDILVETCLIIQEELRTYDRMGRWGGEEFIVVLPETHCQEAFLMAERLCERVRQHPFKGMTQEGFNHLTITIGIAEVFEQANIEQLVKRADDALYQGKHQGRNQVVIGCE